MHMSVDQGLAVDSESGMNSSQHATKLQPDAFNQSKATCPISEIAEEFTGIPTG